MARRITAFFVVSSCIYFCAITWVAPLYVELGYAPQSAGVLLSVLTGTQIFGSLIIPRLAQRGHDRRPWLLINMLLLGSGVLGLAIIPAYNPWLWVILMGVGLGGMFPLILTLPLDYTKDQYAAGRLNSMMFGIGLTIAGGSPYLAGLLRDFSHGYTVPFLVLAALVVVMALIATGFRPATAANQVS
jgi:CP family cyanate transporter-like MFS transporter